MKIKNLTYILIAGSSILFASAVSSCNETHTYYDDKEYVMFPDTVSINYVQKDASTINIPVASTIATDYDRNFAVEVIDKGSKAIEGKHYTIPSNTVTIKAGERVGNLALNVKYDAMTGDTLNVRLRLVAPDAVKWDLYGDATNVKLIKTCPFLLEDFEGWAVVTSLFLYNYPGDNTSIQRLIKTTKKAGEENTVTLHSFLYDGYDVDIKFEDGDPAKPWVKLEEDQVLSDEASVFGTIHGDNHILCAGSPYYNSYYNSCDKFAVIYLYVYVEYLGEPIGYVDMGAYNIIEWVSDEEADRLQREEGM